MAKRPFFSHFSLFLSEGLDRNWDKASRGVLGAGWAAVLQSWQNLLRLALLWTGRIKRGIVSWAFPAPIGC